MASEFYEVNGRYFYVDDITGDISQIVIKDKVTPSQEDLVELVKLLSKKKRH
jgi:hypothetical protein